jgi:hypothetical protein
MEADMAPRNQQPEMKFQNQVIALTHGRNLWAVQTNPAHFNHRVAANKGFPDLMIVGPGGVKFRELKTMNGMGPGGGLGPDQITWRDRLKAAGQDWDIWTPADLGSGRIERELASIETPDEYSDDWALVQLGLTRTVFDEDAAPAAAITADESVQQADAVPWPQQLAAVASALLPAVNQR